jgi:hypothetical protein
MTTQRLMIALVSGALALASPAAFAAAGMSSTGTDNLAQAIDHTQQAIQSGQQDDASSLVQHADNAIDAAKMAEKGNNNRKIKMGVRELYKAIHIAKGTHSEKRVQAAVKRAQTALADFEAAQPQQ